MSLRTDHQTCQPILSLQALLNFDSPWKNLVEPIAPRSRSRHLGDRYQVLDFKDEPIAYVDNEARPQVLLCHDFKGNYLNDKYINGVQGEGQWVDYRFYNWAAIDIFCYFSHNFVTVPTLQWLNCAHRNGVKVIGTLIIEQQNAQLLRDILQSEEFMSRVVDALVRVSKVCQFHGWLLNIEYGLDPSKIDMLCDFVRLLTERCHREIPGSLVIWYDAIAKSGRVDWQNELNNVNDAFFLACDGIFLNYAWNRQKLERTENYIRNYCPERRVDVFVGIDVFGRSQRAQMDTNAPLEQVMAFRFSVALFAPGWTFESLEASSNRDLIEPDDRNVQFLQMNDRFWNRLWRHLYIRGPLQLPFYSSFCLGSGKFYKRLGKIQSDQCWFNLAKQNYQPTIPYNPPLEFETSNDPLSHWTHHFNEALDGGSCLKLRNVEHDKRLFACDFSCEKDLIVCYAYRRSNPTGVDLALILKAYCPRRYECTRIVCSDRDCHVSGRPNEMRAIPLDKEESLQLLKLGATSQLPLADTINGWDIRYYYLSAEKLPLGIRIVDIGLKLHKDQTAHTADYALLGAVHLQAGLPAHRQYLAQRTVLSFERPE